MVQNLSELIPALHAAKKFQAAPEASTADQRITWLRSLLREWGQATPEELRDLATESQLSENLIRDWDFRGAASWLGSYLEADSRSGRGVSVTDSNANSRFSSRGVIALLQPRPHGLRLLTERLAPALLAGNSVVIKMSSKTPTASVLIERWLLKAGVPAEVAVVVAGRSADYGQFLISHPAIRGVSAIGRPEVVTQMQKDSTALGRAFQAWTGGRSTLLQLDPLDEKGWSEILKVSLSESGGSRPYDLLRVFVLEKDESQQFEALKAAVAGLPLRVVSAETADLFRATLTRMKQEEGKHTAGGEVEATEGSTRIRPAIISHLAQCSEDQQVQTPVPVVLFATVKYAFDAAKWVNNASQGFAIRINGPLERVEKLKEKFEVGYLAANRDFDPAESLLFGVKDSAVGNTDLDAKGSFFSQVQRVVVR